ncbi:MAG: Rieske 2Fe-2S domain-containing protein [Myxococcales bacterium]|nr:Rieske 2Fe-2S domain-containing protein [Myxococcales bacterium]
MFRFRVCEASEVGEGELKIFAVKGAAVPILVTRVDGELIAGTSMCPHEDVSLVRGCIRNGAIVCKAHGYTFDLQTGACSHDPKLRWHVYKITVTSGQVFVDLA